MPESTRADRAHANTIPDDRKRAAGPTPLAELRLAPGTRYTYDRALLGLDGWLDGRPVTDESLAGCLGALFDRGLVAASAETAVAAERARCAGEASPAGRAREGHCLRSGAMAPVAASGRSPASRGGRRTAWRSWPGVAAARATSGTRC